ncbi:carbohydrate sulfotransferase 12-like [Gouania willdenowi]|uniref:Carbohydrate sulfotransferase n=1 Tax=Gouania willdenowi TaxID=441366 RepID=A0A8C5E7Z7_GOUWI|nr:carbohydrate sulfotransferase 12-like [Gouania willdenowi]
MGVWRGFRVAFTLGSLFMILMIFVYWDDIGNFNFYPQKHSKHGTLHAECCNWTMIRQSQFQSTNSSPTTTSITVSTTTASSAPIPDQDHADKQQNKDKLEQMRKKTLEEGEPESTSFSVDDKEQEVRKQMIMDVCSGKNFLEFPGRTQAFEQIPNRELDHLIVDDTHQIIYCYVPKVACTNWKRVMVVLSQSLISPSSGKPYTDPGAVPSNLVHNSSLHLTFAKFWRHYGSLSRHLMTVKLQHYTKFLFVRDPFVRLISAFRNKFGRPNEDFYKEFGSVMLSRYSNLSEALPNTAAEAFAAGIKPTFHQFIKYLLDPETEADSVFNEHWRQVYRLCHPCQVKYDFIGRLETLESDAAHLLKLLKVDNLLHFPLGARNRTAASWEEDWFAQIPLETQRELYRLYEPDFRLFGYPKPDRVLHH